MPTQNLWWLLLLGALAACSSTTAPATEATHDASADSHADTDAEPSPQGDGDGGCVETIDPKRPCVEGAVLCGWDGPCSGEMTTCVGGEWVAESVGNCCRYPDGGEYGSMGGCDPESEPDPGDDADADGGDDADADGGDDASADAGHDAS